MEPLSLVIGIGIAVVAAGLKYFVERFWRDRTKEMSVHLDGGRIENLTVAANADVTQIISALRTELNIEEHVRAALREFELRVHDFQQRSGTDVDFVAQLGDKKIAIEVKNRLDRVTVDQLKRYLADEPGLSGLLLFSVQAPPRAILKNTKELVESGRVAFVQIPDIESIKPVLFGALERALGLSQA